MFNVSVRSECVQQLWYHLQYLFYHMQEFRQCIGLLTSRSRVLCAIGRAVSMYTGAKAALQYPVSATFNHTEDYSKLNGLD